MDIYSLVFSNNRNYRLARHSIFWIMWIAYYTIFSTVNLPAKLPLSHRFLDSLIEVTLSTPLDMIFCYAIIYFLIPEFLFRGRYISMLLLWVLFSVIFMVVFELYVIQVVPFIRSWYGVAKPPRPTSYSWLFLALFSQINMEGCMAAAIKLGKLSFIKQKEVDLLRNEKAKLQTQTDKAEMQPLFLVDIINRVEQIAKHNPAVVPGLLRKINNLVSYIIYENQKNSVDLKRELELIKEYVELEQNTRDRVIEVDICISGNTESHRIATFVLLPCIQNAFKQVSALDLENRKLYIQIKVQNGILDFKIRWYKPLDTSTLAEGKNIILQNLSKRLNLIYPQSHEMKVFIQVEEIIVTLQIDLKRSINS